MSIDDATFGVLLEQSSDLHSDAMVRTRADLDELVERHADEAAEVTEAAHQHGDHRDQGDRRDEHPRRDPVQE